VAAHSSVNGMTADNLAIVVGPNILKSPDIMSGNVHKTFARVFKVVELMIRWVRASCFVKRPYLFVCDTGTST
jgi:hypothetical protein